MASNRTGKSWADYRSRLSPKEEAAAADRYSSSVYYDECAPFSEAHYRYLEKRLMESKSRMYKVTYRLGFYKGERYVHAESAEAAIAQVQLWCETRMPTLIAANVPESYVAEPPA